MNYDPIHDEEHKPTRKYVNPWSKCRSLKKPDGEPFWRKDIQYDFLCAIFDDTTRCFSGPSGKMTFSELYAHTLAESNKCSKILRERLLAGGFEAKSVSQVCLLVNTGRMNTTINFIHDLRSSLRTYHSIPCLQKDPQQATHRVLQDTPRLKGILKGVCEGGPTPPSLQEILTNPPATKPNTNVVQMVFHLSNHAPWLPFYDDAEAGINSFMDLFVKASAHPLSRARRFLWVMYTYLETSFSPAEIAGNPFGPTPPPFHHLAPFEQQAFDNDTPEEIAYSEQMHLLRTRFLQEDEAPKKRKVDEDEDDDEDVDMESRRKRRPQSTQSYACYLDSSNDFLYAPRIETNPPFSLPHLRALVADITDTNVVLPPGPLPENMLSARKDIVEKSKPIIRDVRTSSKASTASFNKKTLIFGNWLYRYFQYKKSIGNKLLGMEWEDIRSDLLSGVEDTWYAETGRSLMGEGEYSVWPVRDFDSCNEKLSGGLQVTSWVNDWWIRTSSS